VAQDPGQGYGVAPQAAADFEYVIAGAQRAVPRVGRQVGGGNPLPCVRASPGEDGEVDRDVETLEGR
jgi:hypothetical protein